MSRFLSPLAAKLEPYTPGEQPQDKRYVKLNTNESPFPPAPGVISAISANQVEDLRLYSDPTTKQACEQIAKYYGLQPNQVLLGNGSDEILSFCFQAFCSASGVRFADITYGFYKVWAALYNIPATKIPLDEDFKIRVSDYENCGQTVIIANPNAPTGLALSLAEVEQVVASNANNVVIIDEAYVDFGAQSAVELLRKYDNLVVVQTFSKSRSLAGGRLGFALASAALIDDLNRIKFSFNPYNVNRLSILAAAAAMEDVDYFKKCTGEIQANRAYTTKALQALGFSVTDSKTNFIFAKSGKISGETYYKALKEKGVLVRHFKDARIADYVRITIGSQEQMDFLLQCTKEILEEQLCEA